MPLKDCVQVINKQPNKQTNNPTNKQTKNKQTNKKQWDQFVIVQSDWHT